MEGVKKILKKIFDGEKPEIKHVELDPSSVRDNHIIQAQQNQIAELQGSLTRFHSEKAAERESEKDFAEEQMIKEQLNEQEFEIRKVSMGKGFSMKTFWASYFGLKLEDIKNPKSKLSKALRFVTFDRSSDIAPFEDIIFAGNHIVLATKNNRIVLRAENLNDVFQSTGALSRDIMSGMIPINLDSEGGYVENFMTWKPAEIVRTEDGKFEYKTARKEPLYKLLQDKESLISELRDDLEQEQLTNVELQNKVNDLQLATKVSIRSAEIANNEKSKMAEKASEIEKVFMRTQQDLVRLQNIGIIDQDNIMKLERQVKSLLEEAEKSGATPAFKSALEKIEQIASMITNKEILVNQSKTSVGTGGN